jgi:NAD(P)-dependent dehydrogenase (short-subunit alcohol dehydrogenase family)
VTRPRRAIVRRRTEQTDHEIEKRTRLHLIELLITASIIGILASIAIPRYASAEQQAADAAAKSDLRGDRPRGLLRHGGEHLFGREPGGTHGEVRVSSDERGIDGDDHRRRAELEALIRRRFGSRREIAAGVAFLASEEAAYITGAILPIDDGLSMSAVTAI